MKKQPRELARLHADDLALAGNFLYFSRASISAPSEIARLDLLRQIAT